jgi:hypothetical protein
MSKQFLVEQWAYKPSWRALSEEQRGAFAMRIGAIAQELAARGIRTLGFGRIDHALDMAPQSYDFWSLWELDSDASRDDFLAAVAASGWYDYFNHANTGGALGDPAQVLGEHVRLA